MRSTGLRGAAVAACLALAVTACGGNTSSPTASASGNNTLEVFSWWTSGSEDAALKELYKVFEARNPGVKIVNGAVAGGGGGNAQAVLQTRLLGNNAPDTWQTHPGAAIGEYIDGDLVADLSSVYQQDKLADVLPKSLIDSQTRDGKQYSITIGAHRGNVLWFNKKLLAQAGIKEVPKNYTPDQFLTDLGKLKDKGITPLCLGGKDTFAVAELFENTLLGVVGPDTWDSLTSGKTKWDDPKVKEAAGVFAKMLPYVDSDSGALTWDQAILRLGEGKCAFNSMGDWAYGELAKAGLKDNEDFGYVPHPGNNGSFILVGDSFAVARNGKGGDLGLKWASAIASKEASLEFAKKKGGSPVRSDVDLSTLPPYQQGSTASFRADRIVQTIVHGQAVKPQFQQAFYDAVTQFVQSKNADSLAQALNTAATA